MSVKNLVLKFVMEFRLVRTLPVVTGVIVQMGLLLHKENIVLVKLRQFSKKN